MPLFETVKYKTIKKETKNIELREYSTFYLANTTVVLDNNYSNGFNQVFNYISGENESKEKISMTTPVISTSTEKTLTTGFVIPSKFSDNAPAPSNKNVQITKIEKGLFLSIRFRGKWTTSNFDKYDSILKSFIDSNNYKSLSSRYILRYQPPFVPSVFRRNEIIYRVEETS